MQDIPGPFPHVLPSDVAPSPPRAVHGILGDITAFLVRTPRVPTRINFSSDAEREDYSNRVLQRLGADVSGYSVLNLHRIGIDAPARYAFEELLNWNRDSTCWPNELATIESDDGGLENLSIQVFGKSWLRKLVPGGSPLFRLKLTTKQVTPSSADPDNGRYLLYRCEGGYPIGIFAMYVRSSLPRSDEVGATQVFVGASFNFYGKERWPLFHPVNRVWETIHDRVTRNMLNRYKQLSEWNFTRMQEGRSGPMASDAHPVDD